MAVHSADGTRIAYDEEGDGPPLIVVGGALSDREAAAHGTPIAKLVAYEPPLIPDERRRRPGRDLLSRLEELLIGGHRIEAAEFFLTEGVGMSKETVAAMKAGPTWQRMRANAHTLPYDVTLSNDPGELEKIQVPTLLVAGGASPDWARDVVAALAANIPGAETMVLDGQDHGVSDDAITPVLEKFFS